MTPRMDISECMTTPVLCQGTPWRGWTGKAELCTGHIVFIHKRQTKTQTDQRGLVRSAKQISGQHTGEECRVPVDEKRFKYPLYPTKHIKIQCIIHKRKFNVPYDVKILFFVFIIRYQSKLEMLGTKDPIHFSVRQPNKYTLTVLIIKHAITNIHYKKQKQMNYLKG